MRDVASNCAEAKLISAEIEAWESRRQRQAYRAHKRERRHAEYRLREREKIEAARRGSA